MSEAERLKFWIHLLEMEVEALRSVIAESNEETSCYSQMGKADAIKELKNNLVHP